MLTRRRFLKFSAMAAAGALLPLKWRTRSCHVGHRLVAVDRQLRPTHAPLLLSCRGTARARPSLQAHRLEPPISSWRRFDGPRVPLVFEDLNVVESVRRWRPKRALPPHQAGPVQDPNPVLGVSVLCLIGDQPSTSGRPRSILMAMMRVIEAPWTIVRCAAVPPRVRCRRWSGDGPPSIAETL
jgi:TAT (twin-arginine translocation) pathway signal sequence